MRDPLFLGGIQSGPPTSMADRGLGSVEVGTPREQESTKAIWNGSKRPSASMGDSQIGSTEALSSDAGAI